MQSILKTITPTVPTYVAPLSPQKVTLPSKNTNNNSNNKNNNSNNNNNNNSNPNNAPQNNPSPTTPTEPTQPPTENNLPTVEPTIPTVTLTSKQIIINEIEKSWNQAKDVLVNAYTQAQNELNKKGVSITAKSIIALGILLGAAINIIPALFANPLSFSEVGLIPMRLLSLLMTALGIKKRNRPWGTVYDAVTKQPLDPAYVVLKDAQGNEVQTSITDLDGRYGFLVQKGIYTLEASKTDYKFLNEDKNSDELYQDLYHGEQLTINSEDEVITKNIPMQPLKFNWNEYAKKEGKYMKFYSKKDFIFEKISSSFFVVGGIIALLAFFLAPRPYNTITLIIYIILLIFRQFGIKLKDKGTLLDKTTHLPISFAIVRIFSKATNLEMVHKVSDKYGKFYCIIPNGTYYLKIDKKLDDGSYQNIHTSDPMTVTKGIIRGRFVV